MAKLIITERQYKLIKENIAYSTMVEEISNFLTNNYEPIYSVTPSLNEYYEEPSFKVKVDDRVITPKQLFEYIKNKFNNVGDEFVKQVINDWAFGKIDKKNNMLSKNVSLNQ